MQGVTHPQLNGPLPWKIVAELFRVRTGEMICEDYVRTIGTQAERKLRDLLADDPHVVQVVGPIPRRWLDSELSTSV